MLPHFGHITICPIADLSRTLSRASQVVQVMVKSASAKTNNLLLFQCRDLKEKDSPPQL